MKTILTIYSILFSINLFATVDGLTSVSLVHWDHEGYTVLEFPFTGCYGIEYGPQVASFTEEFITSTGMGCGMNNIQENVNELSCASSVWKWDRDHTKVLEVKIDISSCKVWPEHKKSFLKSIKEAAYRNFGKSLKVEITDNKLVNKAI